MRQPLRARVGTCFGRMFLFLAAVVVLLPLPAWTQDQEELPTPPTRREEPAVSSLFFSREEIAALRAALAEYEARGGTPADLDGIIGKLPDFGKTQAERLYTYPQFYLESLVWHSPRSWMAQVNGQKFTEETPQDASDIRVTAIDENKVTLEWRPASMDKVNAVWEKSPAPDIFVDAALGTVTFTLRHNQTFSSYVMRVLEGKVRPVVVNLNTMPVPVTVEPEIVPPAQGDGLGGLLDAYKNMEGVKQ